MIAGFFVNVVLNPNNVKVGPKFKACFEGKAPDRLKTYVSDFQAVMKEYLDKRAEDHKCTF